MQTRSKILIAAGLVVALSGVAVAGATYAHGSKSGWQRGGYHHGAYGEHGHKGRRMMHMLELYDANDDGKLTQAEIDGGRNERLAKFDTDSDQRLTLEEYQALWMDAMRERMVDRFQHLDDDGDAVVTLEEFTEPFANVVERRDRNGDGALSRDDFRSRWDNDDDDDDDDRRG